MTICPRCQLEPTGCLCVLNSTNCLAVGGDGSEADPFSLNSVIDPGEELLTCGVDGLTAELPESIRVTPSCQLRGRAFSQVIPSATLLTIIELDDVVFDTDNMASLSNNRIIARTPGVYTVSFNLRGTMFVPSEGFGAYLWVNDTELIAISNRGFGGGPNYHAVTLWPFSTNDFVQLAVTNPSAGVQYSLGSAWAPSLTMTFGRGPI